MVLVFSTAYKPFIGGAELAVQEIARRLKNEYEFIIITARFQLALRKIEKVSEGTIIRLGFGVSWLDKLLLPFFGTIVALRIIRQSSLQNPPIILWGTMVSYASIAAFFVKIFRQAIPFVLTIQEGNIEWEPSMRRAGWRTFWWRFIFKKVDHVTAISNFLAVRVREKGYIGPISIVPNGVDEKLLEWRPGRDQISFGDPVSKRTPIIFSASRLVYKNGIDILLEAAAKLKDEFDFKIVLAGDGRESEKLKVKSEKLGIQSRIKFLGNVPYGQLPEFYKKADIFVRPSRSEGLGSAFLEAMAAGLITIGTPVGGIPDFLEDRKTGFLAKPNDADDLARVMRKTFHMNDGERNAMIERARSMIRERYLWNNIAEQINVLFNKAF